MATFTQTKQNLLDKWKKDWTLKSLLLVGLPILVLGFLFHSGLFLFLFFIVAYTCFDVYGYQNIEEIGSINKAEDINATTNYRVIQNIFYVVALLFIGICGSWIAALACIVTKFFTTCDYLFYVFQKQAIPEDASDWLNWSIFGITKHIGLTAKKSNFETLAIVGLVVGLALILLF